MKLINVYIEFIAAFRTFKEHIVLACSNEGQLAPRFFEQEINYVIVLKFPNHARYRE